LTLSTNSKAQKIVDLNWVSQAEAARLRGVSRQAISRLVQKGRLRTLSIGGHLLVSREDIRRFKPLNAGRPAKEK